MVWSLSLAVVGGYRVQARSEADQERLLGYARLLEQCGCFSLVLEAVSAPVAARITRDLAIPTIGIGAGPECDGQVLVVYDMLGLTEEFKPRFVRRYSELAEHLRGAFTQYITDVKGREFPKKKESY